MLERLHFSFEYYFDEKIFRVSSSSLSRRGKRSGWRDLTAAWTAECDGLQRDRSLEFSVCTVNVVVVVEQNITKCHAVITFQKRFKIKQIQSKVLGNKLNQ